MKKTPTDGSLTLFYYYDGMYGWKVDDVEFVGQLTGRN
jgi:hypothetical protein